MQEHSKHIESTIAVLFSNVLLIIIAVISDPAPLPHLQLLARDHAKIQVLLPKGQYGYLLRTDLENDIGD